jgi:hypothetical protein
MTAFNLLADAVAQVNGLHQSAPDRVRTFKHTLDFSSTGELAAAANGDTFDLFEVASGTIFRYTQVMVIRDVSTGACTFKANAAQTAVSIAAGADALIDATPAAVTVTGNAETATITNPRGVADNDGGKITASIASGSPAGAVIDVYTRLEIFD